VNISFMLEFDFAFPHDYAVEEFGELPGTGILKVPLIYFPRPKRRAEHNGEWLKVNAKSGKTWAGAFAFGPGSRTAVISTPEPNTVCVVSKGAGYVVNAEAPEQWEEVGVCPVTDFRPMPEHKLLVFSDFTRLAAYGNNGLVWRSPRVCWDGLKITNVTTETIEGTGYDPTDSMTQEMRFVVDLKTGCSLIPAPISIDGKAVW
jgi:hypothetical protein